MGLPGWRVADVDDSAAAALAADLGLRPLTARLLVGRGIANPGAAARFLAPRLADMRPPDGIADLDPAVERLVRAIEGRERVGVFGDYDVDGVTSAAVLTTALRALGAEVVPRAASRASGYGLGPADVGRFVADGCRVLVTCDCGTSDFEALGACRRSGVDAIVIDHHQVPAGERLALALINPHRPDDRFPFKGLASCGVAFYLAAALRTRLRAQGRAEAEGFDPRDLLDLVALGTLADLVPLKAENRILVSAGLRALGERRRPGLRALCEVAEIGAGPIGTHEVGFRLGPRLNAAGRLGDAQAALDLLLATDDAEGRRRALELDDRNRERQQIQGRLTGEAMAAAEEQSDAAAVVVGGEGWHRGVVGIVAAKLVDRFRRPAVVVGFEQGEGRGSARSAGGLDLYASLAACREHLERFGGHAAAAGLSVRLESFASFRQAFLMEVERRLRHREPAPVAADAALHLRDLDVGLAAEIARLAPFGSANDEPLLAFRGVTARATRVVGRDHLQLTVERDGAVGEAIAFGMAAHDPGGGAAVDLLGHADLDTFRGVRRARLRVKHIYPADPPHG